jgi:hypothetical protein
MSAPSIVQKPGPHRSSPFQSTNCIQSLRRVCHPGFIPRFRAASMTTTNQAPLRTPSRLPAASPRPRVETTSSNPCFSVVRGACRCGCRSGWALLAGLPPECLVASRPASRPDQRNSPSKRQADSRPDRGAGTNGKHWTVCRAGDRGW